MGQEKSSSDLEDILSLSKTKSPANGQRGVSVQDDLLSLRVVAQSAACWSSGIPVFQCFQCFQCFLQKLTSQWMWLFLCRGFSYCVYFSVCVRVSSGRRNNTFCFLFVSTELEWVELLSGISSDSSCLWHQVITCQGEDFYEVMGTLCFLYFM